MLGSKVMRTPAAWLSGLLLLATAPRAGAQAPGSAAADSGLFVVFEQGTPVAHERYAYQWMGDSLLVSATTERSFKDDKGQRRLFTKTMLLVVDAHDLGLMRYLSNQDFDAHKVVRGLLPTDTVMTHYDEFDGMGSAERVVQPPGRLFVLDPQLFTLFDVLCRSLAGKQFETRNVQLAAFGRDSLTLPVATVSLNRPDTVTVGGRRVPARHYSLDDHGVRFELWADARGRMLRLENRPSGISVERIVETPPAAPPRRRPPIRR